MQVKGIFHLHTNYSFDSFLSYKKIVKYGIRNKLDFVAITDHNSIEGAIRAKQFKNSKFPESKLQIIIGTERSTDQGDIIGLFLKDEIKSTKGLEVIDEIHEQKGLAVLPHPFKDHNLSMHLIRRIDIIEVFNGRTSCEANKKAENIAKLYKKPTLVGSDAHFYRELDSAICAFECNNSNRDFQHIFLHSRRKFMTTRNNRAYYLLLSQAIRAYKRKNLNILMRSCKEFIERDLKSN